MIRNRKIDPHNPELPPTNDTFGILALVSPGVYKMKYTPSHANQTRWGWGRMTDVNDTFYQRQFLKPDARKRPPSTFSAAAHILCQRFGPLMGGRNVNQGGGKMNYILVRSDDESKFDCHFDVPCNGTEILKLVNADPYLLFLPTGWVDTILRFDAQGIQCVDRIAPPAEDVAGNWRAFVKDDETTLYAHTESGPHQSHFVAHRSRDWDWDLMPISKPRQA